MPSFDLIPHPSSPRGPVRSIRVDINLIAPAALAVRYRAEGKIDEVSVPAIEKPARTDDLWRHTCFEGFFGLSGSDEYFEFNFSPSGQWAAYHFTGYREGMSAAIDCPPPNIVVTRAAGELTLTAGLDLEWMSGGALNAPMRVALSAIIEDRAGTASYWALAHPSAKPDFHHPESFISDLKKESRP